MSQLDPSQPIQPAAWNIRSLALAVDSHSWEDFPSYHQGKDAAEVLCGWTALWHPQLVFSARSIPSWQRIDQWPEEAEGLLMVVPSFSIDSLPDQAANRLSDLGGKLIESNPNRAELIESIFAAWQPPPEEMVEPIWPESVVKDFFALGYCYLQVQLMTKQLRHSTGMDDEHLSQQLLKAVDAAVATNSDSYDTAIQSCFDLLIEERSRYYPTMANLVDYVLLTPQTLGPRLKRTLQQSNPLSLQASGETIDAILKNGSLASLIRQRLDSGQLTIAGGEYFELPTALLSSWANIRQFQRGLASQAQLDPNHGNLVYARRSFGLRVGLPAVLEQFGISSVVHSTMDDGVFPQTSGSHIRWEGDDHTTVDGLVSPPLLAAEAETWLTLSVRIGEMIDVNHFATTLLVHWPGATCEFYDDVIHSCRYGEVLGSFVTLQTYFDEASDPGYTQNYSVDDYRGPWLEQWVAAKAKNPISRSIQFWKNHVRLMQSNGWAAMQSIMHDQMECSDLDQPLDNAIQQFREANETEWKIDDGLDLCVADHRLLDGAVTYVNPLSFPSLIQVPIPSGQDEHPAVVLTDQSQALIRMPAMGFVAFAPTSHSETKAAPQKARVFAKKSQPALAEGSLLQNEFFVAEVNPTTGGLAGIKKHHSRINMISQQLALREMSQRRSRSGGANVVYSTMVADKVEVVECSKLTGTIRSQGHLSIADRQVAKFVQTMIIRRGEPIIYLQFDLEDVAPIAGPPWQNYLACRFAWNDESAVLASWQTESKQAIARPKIVSPVAIEVDQHRFKTSILTGGLPFHQKIGYRQIDSLLLVSGESARSFQMAVGIDLPYPDQAGLRMMADSLRLSHASHLWQANHAWLFHFNCKNVMALYWPPTTSDDGRSGVRVVLKETAARAAELTIRCFRPLTSARVSLLDGSVVRELSVSEDQTAVSLSPLEIKQVELFW